MENLWKSFDNILWTTDDSAIGRIKICGDLDSAIGRKIPKKRVLHSATVLDKVSVDLWMFHVRAVLLIYSLKFCLHFFLRKFFNCTEELFLSTFSCELVIRVDLQGSYLEKP